MASDASVASAADASVAGSAGGAVSAGAAGASVVSDVTLGWSVAASAVFGSWSFMVSPSGVSGASEEAVVEASSSDALGLVVVDGVDDAVDDSVGVWSVD